MCVFYFARIVWVKVPQILENRCCNPFLLATTTKIVSSKIFPLCPSSRNTFHCSYFYDESFSFINSMSIGLCRAPIVARSSRRGFSGTRHFALMICNLYSNWNFRLQIWRIPLRMRCFADNLQVVVCLCICIRDCLSI